MKLDLTSLVNALDEFKDALKYYAADFVKQDENLLRHLMAASIKAFEFTYELSIKFIRRYLEMTEANPEAVAAMTFGELIRTASARDLLKSDIKVWKEYRNTRNITSHTYDEDKAIEVMENIPQFVPEAEYLLTKLQERNKVL